MSDTDDDFRLNLVQFNLRTRRASLIPQLHVDWDALRLRSSSASETSTSGATPTTIQPGLLPLPARQRGRSVLEGLAPSWIDLERGGVQIPGGPLLRPTIQLRERGFKLELEWTW
jgi:hypothetical protein